MPLIQKEKSAGFAICVHQHPCAETLGHGLVGL
jgi:hypothetical protein